MKTSAKLYCFMKSEHMECFLLAVIIVFEWFQPLGKFMCLED